MGARQTYDRAMLYGALLALPAAMLVVAQSFWPNADLFQPNGFYLGSDFVNYWTGGRLTLAGRADVVYDLVRYNAHLRDGFSPELRLMNFSYPPHALIVLAVVGAFPYLVVLPLWSLAGAAGFIAVALGRWPGRQDGRLLWALALAPVLWVNIVFGQFGLLLALLFVGALRALPVRPILAGVLIGALTIKPQLGLLLPLMLVLTHSWRAFAAAALTALALVALSVAVLGVEPWQVYLADTVPFQWRFLEVMNGFYRFQMITPYAALWFLGLPVGAALAGQWVISVLVAIAAVAVIRGEASWPLKATVVAFGSVLMVPYVLAYDLAIPFAALVWYLRDGRPRAEPFGVAAVGTVWALPFGLGILSQTQGLPLLPLALLVVYIWVVGEALGWSWVRRARQSVTSKA